MKKPKQDKYLRYSVIIQVLNKELEWCIANPDPAFHPEYRKGFQNGLIQAKYLIAELARVRGWFEA